jgi:hypothetical protein
MENKLNPKREKRTLLELRQKLEDLKIYPVVRRVNKNGVVENYKIYNSEILSKSAFIKLKEILYSLIVVCLTEQTKTQSTLEIPTQVLDLINFMSIITVLLSIYEGVSAIVIANKYIDLKDQVETLRRQYDTEEE